MSLVTMMQQCTVVMCVRKFLSHAGSWQVLRAARHLHVTPC